MVEIIEKEKTVTVQVADLMQLVNEIKGLREDVSRLKPAPKNETSILTTADVMKDLRISRKSLDRRLYEFQDPIPMVKEGNRLLIRKDKYEEWKHAQGL